MRSLLLAVIALGWPTLAAAEPLKLNLSDGAAWTQTSVHTRTSTQNGATQSMTATSVIKMTYRKDGGVGTLRQEFVSFNADGANAEQSKQLAAQAQLIYPAVVEVDDALMPTKVRDWDQMREKIFQAIASMGADAKALATVKASYDKIDAAHAAALFKEEALVGLGQGTALEIGAPRPYAGEAANVLGGPPIKTSGSFRLESVDKAKGRAVVAWSQELDPASLSASMKATIDTMLARMAPDKQADAKPLLAGLTLQRQDHCRFEVDMPTGLALKTDCAIDVTGGFQGQMTTIRETWTITQTPPDKA